MKAVAIGLAGVLAAVLGGVAWAGGEAQPLRLVAKMGDQTIDAFGVEDGMIVMREGDATRRVSYEVRWELQGNLSDAAELVGLAPPFDIVTQRAPGATAEKRTSTTAVVRVGNLARWYPDASVGGLVVVAWLVDGQVRLVTPKPVEVSATVGSPPSTVVAVNLTDELREGVPVVLLWKEGAFIPSRPVFDDPASNRVAMAIYLRRIDSEAAEIIRSLPSLESRDFREATLLHHAARAGFVEAVEMLLAKGVDVGAKDRDDGRPLHDAAWAGREACVSVLLAAGAKRNVRYVGMKTPLDLAVANGAIDAAIELLEAKPNRHTTHVLELAVKLGDADAIRRLVPLGAARVMRKIRRDELVRSVLLGDTVLTQALLDAGMDPRLVAEAAQAEGSQAPVIDIDDLDVFPAMVCGDVPDERKKIVLTGWIEEPRGFAPRVVVDPSTGRSVFVTVFEVPLLRPVYESVPIGQAHWAVVSFIVEADGQTSEVCLVKGTPIDFAGDAVRAMRKWKLTPGMLGGHAVRTRMTVVVTP